MRQLVSDTIDELIELATAQGCSFSSDFRQKTIEKMAIQDIQSTMYLDYQSRRPMEVETYLGSPIKLAAESSFRVPRIETLYAMLHHANAVNLTRPRQADTPPPATVVSQPPPRLSSAPPQRPVMNGNMRGGRSSSGMMPPRRGGPPMPPMGRPPSAQPPPTAARIPREPSLEGLEEFSHLVVYDDMENGHGGQNGFPDVPVSQATSTPTAQELSIRERELALRQRELNLMQQESRMRGAPPPRRHRQRSTFDEDDGEDFFDPGESIPVPHIDPDSVDMMSITSRKPRRAPNPGQVRRNPEINVNSRPASSFSRYFGGGGRKRTSDRIMQEIPGLHDSLMDNPMMGYSSNRFGAVDRNQMHADSRANSLTASRMGDYPPYGYPPSRRNSHSPAAPFPGPGPRMARPITADQSLGPPGIPHGGHPSPPGPGMRAPTPRHPPGHGNAVGPQQFEQHYGVSNPYSAKGTPKHRSLTGSASASAESGDSGASANYDPGNSAHSSQISLGAAHRAAMPTR